MNRICRKRFLYLFFFLGSCCNALGATDTTQCGVNQQTPKSGDEEPHNKQLVGPQMWNTQDPELRKIAKRKSSERLTQQDQKRQKTTK